MIEPVADSLPYDQHATDQLAAQLLEEDGWPFKRWLPIVTIVADRAFRGQDVSVALPALQAAFESSSHVPLMDLVSDAMLWFHLRRGSNCQIHRLLENERYADAIAGALCRAVESGRLTTDSHELLVSALEYAPLKQYRLYSGLYKMFEKNPEFLVASVSFMVDRPSLQSQIPRFLQQAVMSETGYPREKLKEILLVFADILGQHELRTSLVTCCVWYAEAGVDLRGLYAVLDQVITDGKDQERWDAVYAKAFSQLMHEKSYRNPDRLLRELPDGLRGAVLRALTLVAEKRPDRARSLVDRLARELIRPASSLKAVAKELLEQLRRRNMCITPGRAVMNELCEALAQGETELCAFLGSLAERSKTLAKRLLDRLATVSSTRTSALEWLQSQCQDCLDETVTPGCSICRVLPRYREYGHELDVPKEVQKLVDVPGGKGSAQACPACGSLYVIQKSEVWESASEGMGVDVTIRVQRLLGEECRGCLPDLSDAEFELWLETGLQKARRLLRHLEPYLRIDAAWMLAQHALKHHAPDALRELLRNTAGEVRLTALQAMASIALPERVAFTPELNRLLSDQVVAVRKQAAELLYVMLISQNDHTAIMELANGDPVIAGDVLGKIMNDESLDQSLFLPLYQRGLTSDDVTVRSRSMHALGEAIRRQHDGEKNLELLLKIYDTGDPKVREEVLAVFKGIATCLPPLQVIPRILEVIADSGMIGYYATEIVKILSTRSPLPEVLPRLLPLIRNRKQVRREEFITICANLILQHRKSNPSSERYLDVLAEWLSESSESLRRVATATLQTLIEDGVDVTPILEAMLQMLLASNITYVESYFAEPVAAFLARRRDWDNLRRLFAGAKDISGAAVLVLRKHLAMVDITPVVRDLAQLLAHPYSYVRENAQQTLAAFGAIGETQKSLVLSTLQESPVEGPEVLKLKQKLAG